MIGGIGPRSIPRCWVFELWVVELFSFRGSRYFSRAIAATTMFTTNFHTTGDCRHIYAWNLSIPYFVPTGSFQTTGPCRTLALSTLFQDFKQDKARSELRACERRLCCIIALLGEVGVSARIIIMCRVVWEIYCFTKFDQVRVHCFDVSLYVCMY